MICGEEVCIDGSSLTIDEVVLVAEEGRKVRLADSAVPAIEASWDAVLSILNDDNTVAYGIKTGFGDLASVIIPPEDNEKLQMNLIRSHAAGVGRPFPEKIVRAMLLLRANALAKGYSGVRLNLIQTLIDMLNMGVVPVVPEKGSVGASGDLAPLAHMALVVVGEGEAYYNGKRMSGSEALKAAGITPIKPVAKDGLALINGTQAMASLSVFAVRDAREILRAAEITASMSFEAMNGNDSPFDARVSEVRPHSGQIRVAEDMRKLLNGRGASSERRLQDAYSLRCIPQVLGAAADAVEYAAGVVETEINSVTDNPLIFRENGGAVSISGGNFHGEPLAMAMDFLAIAVHEISSMAERRIARLVDHNLSGLPAFLTKDSGLNSGYMIAQYVAAALVSDNKVLCHPASVDSIPTSANQEDHVSMGMNSAAKVGRVIDNVFKVLSIEYLLAAQGLEFRGEREIGRGVKKAYDIIRAEIPPLEGDRSPSADIERAEKILRYRTLKEIVL